MGPRQTHYRDVAVFFRPSTLLDSNGLILLNGFRMISFDARGHADSGKLTASVVYDTQLVDDVIWIMDDRDVKNCTALIQNSF